MALHIRPATPTDEPTVVRFNQLLASESEGKTLHEPTLRAGVRALLADRHKGFYTVAERAGEVVGQVLITFEWSDWRDGWYWWVQSVYVVADARREGVFRALFGHLKEQATADPTVIGLRLYVERENTRAQATYEAMGMTDEGYNLLGLYPLPGRESAIS
jgi:ribosomal protein S18 acetylase RimI-like enzyme